MRVLLVEDDCDLADCMQRELEEESCTVAVTHDDGPGNSRRPTPVDLRPFLALTTLNHPFTAPSETFKVQGPRWSYKESQVKLCAYSSLQPKPHSASSLLHFGASAIAADHVGGDFYDIFEAEPGKITIVLGDVSGKGVPAALLVSVLQGAIRSSTASEHQHGCQRINRMLCERTACERFATLFWGVFDPVAATLRYVNPGHAAPMLFRQNSPTEVVRLDEGGLVLGILPAAVYSDGAVKIATSDMLILYSDGIHEATNQHAEEFGETRLQRIISANINAAPTDLCSKIIHQVTTFASAGAP